VLDSTTLGYYEQGLSMAKMGELLDIAPYTLRRSLLQAGLSIGKRDRGVSLAAYLGRLHTSSTEASNDCDAEASDDCDLYSLVAEGTLQPTGSTPEAFLSHKLNLAENALVRARHELNYRRKAQRDGATLQKISSDQDNIIREALEGLSLEAPIITVPKWEFEEALPDHGLIAVFSDAHFGDTAGQDVPDNSYDYSVATERVRKFIRATIENPKQSNHLVVANLQDNLKGIIHGGIYDSEGSFIESLQFYIKIYTEMLQTFAEVYETVTVYSTGDNHSRVHEKPVTRDKHMDYSRLVDTSVMTILEAGGVTNVKIETTDSGYHLAEVNGANIIMFHGDTLRTYNVNSTVSRSKLQDVSTQVFGKAYRHSISGHSHEAHMKTNQYRGMNVVNGSMTGNTSYGVNSGYAAIVPSQLVIFIDEVGSMSNINVVQFESN